MPAHTFSMIALRKGTVARYNRRMRFDLVVNTIQSGLRKAQRVPGFRPAHGIERIVRDLIEHRAEFGDLGDPQSSDIASFKGIDATARTPA